MKQLKNYFPWAQEYKQILTLNTVYIIPFVISVSGLVTNIYEECIKGRNEQKKYNNYAEVQYTRNMQNREKSAELLTYNLQTTYQSFAV